MRKRMFVWPLFCLLLCGALLWASANVWQPRAIPLWKVKTSGSANIIFSHDGQTLISLDGGIAAASLTHYRVTDGQVKKRWLLPLAGYEPGFSPDGRLIVGIESNKKSWRAPLPMLHFYDSSNAALLQKWNLATLIKQLPLRYAKYKISPDNSQLYLFLSKMPPQKMEGLQEIDVSLWDIPRKKLLQRQVKRYRSSDDYIIDQQSLYHDFGATKFIPTALFHQLVKLQSGTITGSMKSNKGFHLFNDRKAVSITLPGQNLSIGNIFRVSVDGNLVASRSRGSICLWDMSARQLKWSDQVPFADFGVCKFSPDGRKIAWAGRNKQFRHVDLDSRSLLQIYDVETGKLLYQPSEESPADVLRMTIFDKTHDNPKFDHDFKRAHDTPVEPDPILDVAWSPDSQNIAVSYMSSEIKMWRVP